MKKYFLLMIVGLLAWAGGCGSKPTASNNPPPKPSQPSGPAVIPAPSAPAVIPAPNASPNPPPEAKVAGVGISKKGRYFRESVLGTIVATRWRVEEKLTFEVQIPQAMQAYKALNPNGKGPKTNDEFMQKIIKDNGLRLPELPAGERYEYDPETEQLMVVSGEKE